MEIRKIIEKIEGDIIKGGFMDKNNLEKIEEFEKRIVREIAYYREKYPHKKIGLYDATNGEKIKFEEMEKTLKDIVKFALENNFLVSDKRDINDNFLLIGYMEGNDFKELRSWDFESVAYHLDIPLYPGDNE